MSGTIPVKDQKIVCAKCGNRCTLPDCRKEIVHDANGKDPAVIIGELAHIRGENLGSARYDPSYKNPNCHENLIVACPTCHTKIDKQVGTYTIEVLVKIKREHEAWVRDSLKREVINVSFVELSVITKYLISGQYNPNTSFTVIPPKDKIKKNNLSGDIEALITMGLTQANQVTDFIDRCPDVTFGERLKQGFVEEYEKLKNTDCLTGEDLFNALLDFAAGNSKGFREKAAGLSVLVYLFEKCEVFEK
jgi:hypothetical protein